MYLDAYKFLSTLSLRRATPDFPAGLFPLVNFYPRSPCGERRENGRDITAEKTISIHALLAESDKLNRKGVRELMHFYPRSPCGERLNSDYNFTDASSISIHALLAESDSKSAQNSGALLRI